MRLLSRWVLPGLLAPVLLLTACPARPGAPDATPASALAFALSPVSQDVLIIDLRLNRTAGTLPAGGVPSALGLTSDGRLALVANSTTDAIRTYVQRDYAVYSYLGDISVGRGPRQMAMSQAKAEAIVAVNGDSRLAILDVSSRKDRPRVKGLVSLTEAPVGVAASSDGESVAAISQKSLYRLTRTDHTLTPTTVALPGTVERRFGGVAFVGDKIAVTDINANELLLVARDGSVQSSSLSREGVGALPSRVAVNPQGTKLYVVCQGTNSIAVVGAATGILLQHIDLGESVSLPYGLAISPDGTRIYVTAEAGRHLALINASPDPAVTDFLAKTFGLSPSAAFLSPLTDIAIPQ